MGVPARVINMQLQGPASAEANFTRMKRVEAAMRSTGGIVDSEFNYEGTSVMRSNEGLSTVTKSQQQTLD